MTPNDTLAHILVQTRDPEQVRRRFLQAAMEAWDAPLGSQYTVRLDEGETLRMAHVLFYGRDDFEAFGRACEGLIFDDIGLDFADVAPTRLTPLQDHELPAAMVERAWRPFGIRSCITVNTVENGRFAGNFNVFRTEGQPPFGPADGADSEWSTAIHRMQRVVDALMTEREARAPVVWVMRADGTPWMVSDAAGRPDWLPALVKAAVLGGERRSTHYIEGSVVSVDALSGGADPAYLVIERPMAGVRFGRITRLPRHLRTIASYAGHGATVAEIATAMNRSVDTVKSWFKQLYAELGVSSRTELAAHLGEAFTPDAPSDDA